MWDPKFLKHQYLLARFRTEITTFFFYTSPTVSLKWSPSLLHPPTYQNIYQPIFSSVDTSATIFHCLIIFHLKNKCVIEGDCSSNRFLTSICQTTHKNRLKVFIIKFILFVQCQWFSFSANHRSANLQTVILRIPLAYETQTHKRSDSIFLFLFSFLLFFFLVFLCWHQKTVFLPACVRLLPIVPYPLCCSDSSAVILKGYQVW